MEIKHFVKHYTKKNIFGFVKSIIKAVDNVSFEIEKGQVFVLAGESGSGKSTIAKLILDVSLVDSGEMIFQGKQVRKKNSVDLKQIQLACQTVQQNPFDSINPTMKISDIIAEPLDIHNVDHAQRKTRIREVLEEVGLTPAEKFTSLHPRTLSGGQRQRVVLARALAPRPKIIIADEPVSMLDVSMRAEILKIMDDLRRKYGISFLYITHVLATARHFGHKIAIMYKGKIVESGNISEVLVRPRHPYTQALIDVISEPNPDNLNREINIVTEYHDTVGKGC
ncbi:MAG: ATP-binding cassette domain-containing protein [Candidatus Nitrosoabyssus spongiisocia]|nr:MAG: ATP-binding cassette domain-containing protein [Nitrosopumilaceae archaeon AB1(1)]